jgi:chitinase
MVAGALLVGACGEPQTMDGAQDGGRVGSDAGTTERADARAVVDGSVTDPADGGSSPGLDAARPPPSEGWRVVGYFTAWGVYGRDYHVDELPAAQLTHINYAFANISPSGECVLGDPYADTERTYPGDRWDDPLRGSFRQLQLLKERHPHLRTLISVGGWTWSGRFSDVALTEASRARFATSCADFMERYGFDGIDVDWEYPISGGEPSNVTRPEDRANYTLLLRALRRELDARGAASGRRYLLTIAAPAGPAIIENLEVEALPSILDWINVMSYDFHGAWGTRTGFNAPLRAIAGDPNPEPIRSGFNIDAAVRTYLARGVPPSQLVLGVPFYGRSFQNVDATQNGLFQPHGGAAEGTWERGVVDWKDLRANYLPTWTRHWHAEAQVPWLYDPIRRVMISYDDPESLRIKRDYARGLGLGGVMIWEMSADDAEGSMIAAVQ